MPTGFCQAGHGFPHLTRTEWWRTKRTSLLSIPSPNAEAKVLVRSLKLPVTPLTDRCADNLYGAFPPLLVQRLFPLCFNVCVVDAGLDPPPASLPQSLSHFLCLLLSTSAAVLGYE